MSKKSFKASEAFMTDPEPHPIKIVETGKPVPKQIDVAIIREETESTGERFTPPEGYKLVPTESKTARLQLLITPTTKDQLKRRSEAEGRSVNDICNQAIADYLSQR